MSLIADIMLLIAAMAAAFYCRVLAVRLKRLGQTDQGLGGAISALNFQVDEMKSALNSVSKATDQRARTLESLNARGDAAARRLELLLASLHDETAADNHSVQSERSLILSADDMVKQAMPDRGLDKVIAQGPRKSRLLARRRPAELTGVSR